MKAKRLMSLLIAVMMVLSTINVTFAGTNSGTIVYQNDFESENPFGYGFYYSASTGNAELSTEQANDGTKSLKANFYYLDRLTLNLNEIDADLVPGKLYEMSIYVYNIGASTVWFDNYSTKTELLHKAGAWNTYQPIQLSSTKNQWIETKFRFIYNEVRPYINIYDEAGGSNHTVYFDSLKIKDITIADEFIEDSYSTSALNLKRKTDQTVTLETVAALDITETKNTLKVGEETEIVAYTQTLEGNTTVADIIADRALVNNDELTVTSDKESVVKYENGKLVALGAGKAVVTVEYADSSAKMLVSVYADEGMVTDLDGTPWLYVTDPMNSSRVVRASLNDQNLKYLQSSISPLDSYVIHYKRYTPGLNKANDGGSTFIYTGNINIEDQPAYTRFLFTGWDNYTPNIGWNEFDIVVENISAAKTADGYVNFSLYINGEWQDSLERQITDVTNGIYLKDGYTGETGKGVMYDEFIIVPITDRLSVNSITPALDGDNVAINSEFNLTFSDDVDEDTVDGNVKLVTALGQEVSSQISASGNVITIKPSVTLDYDTDYKIVLKSELKALDKEKFAASVGKTVEYSFTTEKAPFTYTSITVDGKNLKVTGLKNNRNTQQTANLVLSVYDGDVCLDTAVTSITLDSNAAATGVQTLTADITENISEYDYEFYIWDSVSADSITSYPSDVARVSTARTAITPESYVDDETVFDVNYNAQTNTVRIMGQIKSKMEDIPVIVRIVPNGQTPRDTNIIRAEEIETEQNGKVGYSFKMKNGLSYGLYDVYLNVKGESLVKKSFNFTDETTALTALGKMDVCTTIEQVSAVINEVRTDLGLLNDGFDNVQAKDMIYQSLLDEKPFNATAKGVDYFVNVYNKALDIALMLDDADTNTQNTIKNENTYWGIEKKSAYNIFFDDLTQAQKNSVYNVMKKAKGLNKLNDSFAAGVISQSILEQTTYNTVISALQQFDDITAIDYTTYNSLGSTDKQLAVCEKLSNAASGFLTIDDIKTKFASLCSDEASNGTPSQGPADSSDNSSYSPSQGSTGGTGGSGGSGNSGSKDSYSGVVVLPGSIDTPNPVPDWYVDTSDESTTSSVFNDLGDVSWAVSSINTLYNIGAINGKAEGVFAPRDKIKREELCKIVTLALQITKKDGAQSISFSDVNPDEWYAEYIDICSSRGIINGIGDNTFGVGRYVTREEAATILVRAAEAAGKSLDYYITIFPFDDDEQISDWAKNSVNVLRECQIIDGVSDTEAIFAPKNNVTRAEASKMIVGVMRFSY